MSETVSEESTFLTDGGTFMRIELEYSALIGEMVEDPKLAPYAHIYTELFEFTYKRHQEMQNRAKHVMALQEEIFECQDQLKDCTTRIAKNATKMEALSDEVRVVHEMLDALHSREQEAHETIDNMRKTLDRLEEEKAYNMAMEEEDDKQTMKTRFSGQRECELLQQQVAILQKEVERATAAQGLLEQQTDDGYANITQLCSKLEEALFDLSQRRQEKKLCKRDKSDIRLVFNDAAEEAAAYAQYCQKDRKHINEQQEMLHTKMQRTCDCYHELAVWGKKYSILQAELNAAVETAMDMRMRSIGLRQWVRMIERSNMGLQQQKAIEIMSRDHAQDKKDSLEKDVNNCSKDQRLLLAEIVRIDLNGEKSRLAFYRRRLAGLMRIRMTILRNLKKAKLTTNSGLEAIEEREAFQTKLMGIIEGHVTDNLKQDALIRFLVSEKNQLVANAEDEKCIYEQKMDQLMCGKLTLYNEKVRLTRRQVEVRFFGNLIEGHRRESELNKLQLKAYVDANQLLQQDIYSLRVMLDKLTRHTSDTDAKIGLCGKQVLAIRREKHQLQDRLHQSQAEIVRLRALRVQKKATVTNFHGIIKEQERVIMRQREMIDMLVNEQRSLGMQLQNRNDELGLLNSKMLLFLNRNTYSVASYNQRLADIGVLRLQIKKILQSKSMLVMHVVNLPDFASELYHLDNDLITMKMKVKHQEEELLRPINVHRWRQMEEESPDEFDLLCRIALQQKNSVVLRNRIDRCKMLLHEATVLYEAVRRRLSRLPDPTAYFESLLYKKKVLATSCENNKELEKLIKISELQNERTNNELQKEARILATERIKLSQMRQKRWKRQRV